MLSSGQHLRSYFTTVRDGPLTMRGWPRRCQALAGLFAEAGLPGSSVPAASLSAAAKCALGGRGENTASPSRAARAWGTGYLGLGVWETGEQADSESMDPGHAQGERGSDRAQRSRPWSGRARLACPHSADREAEARELTQ